jgi:probable phosphoglycerate mutase
MNTQFLKKETYMNIPAKPFYFIRHGQTDWNLAKTVIGHHDIPLNETGITQAVKAATILHNIPFKSIVTSPLKRAHETATIIAAQQQISQYVHPINNFKEVCFGSMEAQPKGDSVWMLQWRQGFLEIPQAETHIDFVQRVKAGLIEALTFPDPILIVGHGGTYFALSDLLGFPFSMEIVENTQPILFQPQQCSDTSCKQLWTQKLVNL